MKIKKLLFTEKVTDEEYRREMDFLFECLVVVDVIMFVECLIARIIGC